MFNRVWRGLAALTLITAAACGGDESGPEGSISLTASPTSATIQQGGSGTITVTLTRGGGFADPVNVTVEGLPSGVTASVTPTSLTGTTTSATVTVNVASTVAPATYNATIRASATGVGAATAQYSLTVTALPTYTLSSTPATVSIGQGSSGTATIAINRTNFTDAVALTLVNPPAGITGTFNPASATGNSSTLTINVAGTVATGNQTLTVQGTAAGQPNKTTTVTLTVTPPPDYTLSTTPSTLTIAAGQNATTTVNINRTNFTGAVTLSLANPPAGITATFNPAAPTGNTSTATINVATTVVPGNYNITIQGLAAAPKIDGVDVAEAVTDPKTTTVAITVTTAASFTLSASPNALTIAPGSSGTSTTSIVRTNFTTDVALSLLNPPQGITATFAPASLTGTVLASTATINVPANAAAGTYPVTVQGVGGTLTQSTTINVTVPAPNVTFTASPASLSIQQGGSSTTTLNVNRTAFTGSISPTVTVTGSPAGLTATLNPTAITGNTSTLTVNVGASTPTGTHNIVIASAATPGSPTVTVPVTVTSSGGGGNIVWEFCANEVPLKFWRKSAGAWAEVTGTVVGAVTRFSFSASGNDAGIAFTSGSGSSFFTFIMLATSSELGTTQVRNCATGSAPVTETFNVTGMQPSETGQLGYGAAAAALSPGTPSYNLQVPAGSYDWMAAYGTSSGFPIPSTTYTHYNIGRNEAAGGSAVNINRASATAFVTAPFTVSGGAGGSFYSFIQNYSGSRGNILSLPLNSFSSTPSGNMLFLASGDRQAGDLYFFSASNIDAVGGSVSNQRSQTLYLSATPPAGSTTFTLPTAVPAFTVTQPSGVWTAAGSIPAEYQTAISTATATFQGGNNIISVSATRNWLVANSMSTNFTLNQQVLPNFLPAWQPSAPLTSGTVTLTGGTIGGTGPVAGNVLNSASRIQSPP